MCFCASQNKQPLFPYTALTVLLVVSLGDPDVMHLKLPPSDTHKTSPNVPLFPLLHIPTLHFPAPYLLHLPTLYLATNLSLPEGRAGTASEPSAQQTPLIPSSLPPSVIRISAMLHTAPSAHFLVFLFWYLSAVLLNRLAAARYRAARDSPGIDNYFKCNIIQEESLARGPKLLSIKNYVIEIMT